MRQQGDYLGEKQYEYMREHGEYMRKHGEYLKNKIPKDYVITDSMAYVLHYFVILCFTLRSYNCVKRCGNINFMLQSLNFEFNYKHLYHFLNLHLFSDGEESTNFIYIIIHLV